MMKEAALNAEQLRELLDYNPETGLLTWRIRRGSRAPQGGVAGYVNRRRGGPRVVVKIGKFLYYAHRLIWLWMTGEWPKETIDHRDCDGTNNRWTNLRELTQAQNMQNRRKARSDSKSGLAGAMWHPKRKTWYAEFRASNLRRHLGYFKTKEEAHEAFLAAKRAEHLFATI